MNIKHAFKWVDMLSSPETKLIVWSTRFPGTFMAQRIPKFIASWIFSEMASVRAEAAVAANYIFNDKTM